MSSQPIYVARPGYARICRDCVFFLPALWNIGHANPCRKVQWSEATHKHESPGLVMDQETGAESCDQLQEV